MHLSPTSKLGYLSFNEISDLPKILTGFMPISIKTN